jgi:phage-related protein
MTEEPWRLVLYRDERGREPVTDFIKSLRPDMQSKVLRNLDVLAEKGPSLSMPLSRPIRGYQMAELRSQSAGNICRIFYFATTGRRLVVLHGFLKKTESTPTRELRIATNRREQFLRNAK